MTPDQWRAALADKIRLESPGLDRLSRYYEGRQPLTYMAPELVRELAPRITSVVLNWPRLVVDTVEERLDVEGFRLNSAMADDDLWAIWQANGLDEASQLAHVDALTLGRSFVIVGAGDGGAPVITVESATQVSVSRDPRTRKVRAALKTWRDEDTGEEFFTLYLPDATHYYVTDNSLGRRVTMWDMDEHGLGEVPVVPLVNRPRILSPEGVSELADIIPLSDAACKIATDMMVSAEYHAMPRRWVVGLGPEDFMDADGNPVSEWSRIAGRVWAASATPGDVAMGQFPEANLTNFHETLNALSKLVAAMAGLPPHALGMHTDNPASADAIRSSESRLVKRAERKQRAFGESWEQVMRLALRVSGTDVEGADRMETIWRDPATPTVAQKADAAVKLFGAGVVPLRQVREDLGYSAEQIERMEGDDFLEVRRMTGVDVSAQPPVVVADVEDDAPDDDVVSDGRGA